MVRCAPTPHPIQYRTGVERSGSSDIGDTACRRYLRANSASVVPSNAEWLAPWMPPEFVQAMTSLLSGLAPAVEGLLQAAPSLAGGLSVATWVIWSIGSVLLVLLGAGLHLLMAMWRRHDGGSGRRPGAPVAA